MVTIYNESSLVLPAELAHIPLGKQRLHPQRHPSSIFYVSNSGIWQTVWLEPVSPLPPALRAAHPSAPPPSALHLHQGCLSALTLHHSPGKHSTMTSGDSLGGFTMGFAQTILVSVCCCPLCRKGTAAYPHSQLVQWFISPGALRRWNRENPVPPWLCLSPSCALASTMVT